jgi:hypothetical protein
MDIGDKVKLRKVTGENEKFADRIGSVGEIIVANYPAFRIKMISDGTEIVVNKNEIDYTFVRRYKTPQSVIDLATHYLLNKEGEVALYYRITKGKYNTGEEYRGLAYHSPDFNNWSGTNERNPEEFVKNSLICIKPGMAYNNDTKMLETL